MINIVLLENVKKYPNIYLYFFFYWYSNYNFQKIKKDLPTTLEKVLNTRKYYLFYYSVKSTIGIIKGGCPEYVVILDINGLR